MPTPKNEWSKTTKVKKPKNFALSHNAALRGEQRYTTQLKPLCHKHKN
ncbi:hypothetical protein GQP18_24955 [Vibrio parahaemolyticus]|nr:hypothetical protein [Vibrio parahaemolyticus]QGG33365.1 hypothetical protein GH799_09845 [Vibrio parahaemolyticus 10329]EGQ8239698.1 hypothetical protein [Vibrio parahaemolyticus]EGQ8378170.1 hypothetical protein [Vibrio parahaemolyticus]EGQ8383001.1 hypothetical protein [Vibrio parahaemolyticus]